jgi:hypothetical protein
MMTKHTHIHSVPLIIIEKYSVFCESLLGIQFLLRNAGRIDQQYINEGHSSVREALGCYPTGTGSKIRKKDKDIISWADTHVLAAWSNLGSTSRSKKYDWASVENHLNKANGLICELYPGEIEQVTASRAAICERMNTCTAREQQEYMAMDLLRLHNQFR